MTILKTLNWMALKLGDRRDAELLLCKVLKISRLQIYLNPYRRISTNILITIRNFIKRRLNHEPISYIVGEHEFMGLKFKVNKRCLIPRVETEILVENSLKLTNKNCKEYKIADIGTGSGNIAISLAKYSNNVIVYATDISVGALRLARDNAKLNEVLDKIVFLYGNLLKPLNKYKKLDMIISNPPYVCEEELHTLPDEVKKYEPLVSLNGGKGGLKFYSAIISSAPEYLNDNGYLIFEIGLNQAEKVKQLFIESRRFAVEQIIKDYAKVNRVIIGRVKWTK